MKYLMFTDIHFGKSANSDTHLQYCTNTVDTICDYTTQNEVDAIIMLGDWFDNRNTINIKTNSVATACINKLSNLNIPVYMLVGNHDCYLRNSRRIHSLEQYKPYNNINIIEDITIINDGDFALIPFLYDEENDLISKTKANYAAGHLEIEGFSEGHLTQTITMFKHFKQTFSGHFHDYQKRSKIEYIGNPFQMSFGERNDRDKGFIIFDSATGTSEKIKLIEQFPIYLQYTLPELLEEVEAHTNRDLYLNVLINRSDDVFSIKNQILDMNLPIKSLQFSFLDVAIVEEDINITNILDIEKLVGDYIKDTMYVPEGMDRDLLLEIYGDVK